MGREGDGGILFFPIQFFSFLTQSQFFISPILSSLFSISTFLPFSHSPLLPFSPRLLRTAVDGEEQKGILLLSLSPFLPFFCSGLLKMVKSRSGDGESGRWGESDKNYVSMPVLEKIK